MFYGSSFQQITGTIKSQTVQNFPDARYLIAQVELETDAAGNASARLPFCSGLAAEYGVTLGTGGFAPTTPFNVGITTEKFGQTVNVLASTAVSANAIASVTNNATIEIQGSTVAITPIQICGPIIFSVSGAGANKRVTVGIMLSRMR